MSRTDVLLFLIFKINYRQYSISSLSASRTTVNEAFTAPQITNGASLYYFIHYLQRIKNCIFVIQYLKSYALHVGTLIETTSCEALATCVLCRSNKESGLTHTCSKAPCNPTVCHVDRCCRSPPKVWVLFSGKLK